VERDGGGNTSQGMYSEKIGQGGGGRRPHGKELSEGSAIKTTAE